jgi:negative regulator of genetic competence, sporulation and motility
MALSQANNEDAFNNISNVKKETGLEPDKEREKKKRKRKKKKKEKKNGKKKKKGKITVIVKFKFIKSPVLKSRETLFSARSFIIKKRRTEFKLL